MGSHANQSGRRRLLGAVGSAVVAALVVVGPTAQAETTDGPAEQAEVVEGAGDQSEPVADAPADAAADATDEAAADATDDALAEQPKEAVAESPDVVVRNDGDEFELVGRGWGHGRGMSQWGAAVAGEHGVDYREILSFYYPNTWLDASTATEPLRVRLGHDGSPAQVRAEPGLALRWTDADGKARRRALPARMSDCPVRSWRLSAPGAATPELETYFCGRWHRYLSAAELASDAAIRFVAADRTVDVRRTSYGADVRRGYRGQLEARVRDGELRLVNVVGYEAYLRAVVPSESMASWPRMSLRAQAVASRSYAYRSAQDRASTYFDVYDSTASQAYPGAVGYDSDWDLVRDYEHARTDAAVRDTAGEVLFVDHRAAYAEYGSSNGGWTADGGRVYLIQQRDDWDAAAEGNSRRSWTATVRASTLERSYPSIGRLTEVRVEQRSGDGEWGGRVTSLRIVGDEGSRVVEGEDSVRFALGVNSSYFAFRS